MNLSDPMRTLLLLLLCIPWPVKSQTWHPLGPGGGSDLQALAIHPANPDIMYIGGDIEGVYKTTDGGQTWKLINNNLVQDIYSSDIYYVTNIVLDPVNPDRIYLCTLSGLFRSNDGGQTWEPLYVLNDGESTFTPVADVAIDPTNTDRIFMGRGEPALLGAQDYSTSRFEPWSPDPNIPGELYLSEDGGQTWHLLPLDLPEGMSINDILLLDSQTLLVSTMVGVYKSTDGGQTWTASNTGLPHTNTYGFQWVPTFPAPTIFLTLHTIGDVQQGESTFQGGIFRSTDLGNTWEDITGNLPRFDASNELFYAYWRIAVHPDQPNRLYIANSRGGSWEKAGIYVTDNALAPHPTWTLLYAPQRGAWLKPPFFVDPYAFILGIAPSDPRVLVTGTIDVEISRDAGNTWQQTFTQEISPDHWRGNGLEMMNTETIAFSSSPDTFYIGYDDFGPFRTDDGGNSFIRLDKTMDPVIPPLTGIDGAKDILVDPTRADYLYLSRWEGSQGGYSTNYFAGGVLKSTDGGLTQVPIMNGLPLADNFPDTGAGRFDLAMDPKAGSPGTRTLYAAVYHHGVYKTTDGGAQWTAINQGLGTDASRAWEILVNPFHPQELYLGTIARGEEDPLPQGLFKSSDGGQTWQRITTFPSGGDVLFLHMDALQRLYVALTDNFDWPTTGYVFRSTDGGKTWETLFEGQYPTGIDTHPQDPEIIAIAASQSYRNSITPHGVYLSRDDGKSWSRISSTLQHMTLNFIRFDPHHPDHLYVGTAGGGLWRSTDVLTSASASEQLTRASLTFFPNPFKTRLTIQIRSSSITYLHLFDLLGREIETFTALRGVRTIQWIPHTLPAGLYLLRLDEREKSTWYSVLYLGN